MSLLKFKKGTDGWVALYTEEIRNRLRRDENLADIFDIEKTRENIGLTGDNNTTHYHDSRYLPKIEELKNTIKNNLTTSKFAINGRATADAVTMSSGGTTTLSIKNIHADSISVGRTTAAKNMFMTTSSFGDIAPLATEQCYFDATKNTIHLPAITADSLQVSKTVVADTVNANRVYNAVWNDYAEFFPRGGKTEPGDVIALDVASDDEKYVRSKNPTDPIVGVQTEEYAVLIGGKDTTFEENLKNYIPVALAGRVHVNFIGEAKKGAFVVPSSEPGCAELYNESKNSPLQVFGILVEEDTHTDKRKLKIKIK